MMCDTGAGAVEMWKTAVRFRTFPQHYYDACGAFPD